MMGLMAKSDAREYDGRVVKTYPHDTTAFTEGLLYHEGAIYESTGHYNQSTLQRIDLATNESKVQRLGSEYFGEGLTLWNGKLIQLTYREETAIVYDLDLQPTGETFQYDGEGWGLTHDGQHLIMSNGSSSLLFRDPETFEVVRKLTIYDGRRPVSLLNELEYIDGKIYANVWRQNYLVEIDAQTGRVTARIHLGQLIPRNLPRSGDAVLNGIAFNSDTNRLIVTGKYWPSMFEIDLVERAE